MKSSITLVIAAATFVTVAAFAEDHEKNVTIEQIPSPAAQALKKLAGSEKLTKISEESDDGKKVYEARFMKGGHAREVSVDAKGKLVSVEETIETSAAPDAVRKTIEKDAAGAKVEKMEKVTEKGAVTFEALVSGHGKREELVLSPEGKLLKREAKKKSEKD